MSLTNETFTPTHPQQPAEPDLSPNGARTTSPTQDMLPATKGYALSDAASMVSTNQPIDGLMGHPSHQQKLSEDQQIVKGQLLRDALARRQHELLEARQDPAYWKAMLALKQRDAMLDRAMASEAQMRRYLAFNSGFPPARSPLTGGLLHGGMLPVRPQQQTIGNIGRNRQDPSLYFLPETMLASQGISRNHLLRAGRTQGEAHIVRFPGQDVGRATSPPAPPSGADSKRWGSDNRSPR